MPLHHPSKENKIKETKSKIRKIEEKEIKIVSVQCFITSRASKFGDSSDKVSHCYQ